MVQINKTHIHETLRERKHWKGLVSIKIRDTPFFTKKPPYFTNPSLYGKNLNPTFLKKFKNLTILPPTLQEISGNITIKWSFSCSFIRTEPKKIICAYSTILALVLQTPIGGTQAFIKVGWFNFSSLLCSLITWSVFHQKFVSCPVSVYIEPMT